MSKFAVNCLFERARVDRAALAAVLLVAFLTTFLSGPIFADERILSDQRGSLAVRDIGDRLAMVEWVGPGSTQLAWPRVPSGRFLLLSLRVVPTGLPQVGVVAALFPIWELNLDGVPLVDEDVTFIVKCCRELNSLWLRHPSNMSSDEFSDLTDDERAVYQSRTLSGDGLASLAKLRHLTSLGITGYPLPPTRLQFLANFKHLRKLVLSDMKITDDDLRSLGTLADLEILDLSGTSVTVSGLRSLHDCRSLCCVILNRTSITDELATYLKENPWPKLNQLHLHGCQITPAGIAAIRLAVPPFAFLTESDYSLGSVTPLTPCDVQTVRRHRAACTRLRNLGAASFSVEGNTATGAKIRTDSQYWGGDWIFSDLSLVKGLKHLSLVGNTLTVDALEQLPAHDQLNWLDLSVSSIDDAGMQNLVKLQHLNAIRLSKTRITDAGLESLSGNWSLNHLDLDDTKVTDRGISALRPLLQLRNLNLGKCQITDQGAQRLADMPNLQFICLDDTQVTDRGVRGLAKLPQLKGLSLKNCKITDVGAAKLLEAKNLEYCKLDGTSVSETWQKMIEEHISDTRAKARHEYGSSSFSDQLPLTGLKINSK